LFKDKLELFALTVSSHPTLVFLNRPPLDQDLNLRILKKRAI